MIRWEKSIADAVVIVQRATSRTADGSLNVKYPLAFARTEPLAGTESVTERTTTVVVVNETCWFPEANAARGPSARSALVRLPLATIAPVTASAASSTDVMLVGAMPLEGTGRGLPAAPGPGVDTKLPELPTLSRQVPPSAASEMAAATRTAAPPGAVTIVMPNPMVPSGFGNAMPLTLAARGAPHRSSVPSSEYRSPPCTTLTVTTLQYGSNCQRNVPSGWASAADAIKAAAMRATAVRIKRPAIGILTACRAVLRGAPAAPAARRSRA